MNTLQIFDIQRGSMVDGPGIRTTVFLKGCNLRCAWCHNPESQSTEPVMMFFQNRCTGCGNCVRVCPHQQKHCDFCGTCVDLCPQNAREICGKSVTTREIFSIVQKDRAYYHQSGGGVTFSGGECMLQPAALTELLSLCHADGINTAVDTAGAVSWNRFDQVLPFTDWFLYDVKCWNEQTHIRYTGISNRLILENLEKLAAVCPEKIIVRVPVIPEVNTSEEEMTALSEFLNRLNVHQVELLPYHKMGEHKYENLGRSLTHFSVPAPELVDRFRSLLTGTHPGKL